MKSQQQHLGCLASQLFALLLFLRKLKVSTLNWRRKPLRSGFLLQGRHSKEKKIDRVELIK